MWMLSSTPARQNGASKATADQPMCDVLSPRPPNDVPVPHLTRSILPRTKGEVLTIETGDLTLVASSFPWRAQKCRDTCGSLKNNSRARSSFCCRPELVQCTSDGQILNLQGCYSPSEATVPKSKRVHYRTCGDARSEGNNLQCRTVLDDCAVAREVTTSSTAGVEAISYPTLESIRQM
jgi:hypothetical protein